MLRVGVTGGIGSGKSTVSRRLAELGAHVVDADAVAREVVEPGEPTLQRIRERFGEGTVRGDGTLDRAALAAIVFPDRDALDALDAITGPAIAARVAQRRREAPGDGVSVYDMPLLVERGLWVHEHLAVVVGADVETRVRRLVDQRGLGEDDARHRIAAQATDAQRRAVADVLLDNSGTPDELVEAVDALWHERLRPYAVNLANAARTRRPDLAADVVVEPRADWEARAERVVARLAAALGATHVVTEVSHVGSTSVPGLLAKDVIDVQVGVRRLEDADRDDVRAAFADAGYVFTHGNHHDTPHPGGADPADWAKRFLGGCDPGNHVHVHVREKDSPGWRFALLFRDWLRHVPAERDAYGQEKRRLLGLHTTTSGYVEAKEPWFEGAWLRAAAWAERTGWSPR
ncbi:dephospho-CoA kinase [Terrabacter aeriphilus]|uniref:Dephospho-CoA kinase n=1 Tax=Terrabacter aeriphilus TaxID=515662 RepID=A0ABP9J069_9MICO